MSWNTLALILFPLAVSAAEPEPFDSGARAFEAAKRELLDNYLRADLTEVDLYRAAVQGMLSADPAMQKYNSLLDPAQFADLNAQLKGEVVGIGVRFKLDGTSGRAELLEVVAGSPADRAGLKVGDVILTVDGQAFKGKQMNDLVVAVRGKSGDKVTLGLLRDTGLITRVIERKKIAVELVALELQGELAVLSIRGFAETTPAAVRAALARAGGAKGLIVDLRGNEGGAFHPAIETVKLLLPKGKTVTRVLRRGGKEDLTVAEAEPALKPLPTVVLVNGATGSSAEMAAAALREGLKAPLIGARTKGKWSVQQLKELPNRYVMKYTVAMFADPNGKSWDGEGLSPDIEVQADDAQLKAASSFLRMR